MPPASRPDSPRRFFSVADVAAMLSLSAGDVESMVATGELPAIRVGPADEWRIEQSVLDGFLEAKYEESRRTAIWNGFDFGSIVDINPEGRRIRPPGDAPAP